MIDHLPTASHYREAVAMDEELAELTADIEPTGKPVLPISEMTYDVQLLVQAVSLLRSLVQQREKKRIPYPPLPAPQTARQLVALRRRDERRARLLTRVAEAQLLYEQLHPEETNEQ